MDEKLERGEHARGARVGRGLASGAGRGLVAGNFALGPSLGTGIGLVIAAGVNGQGRSSG